MIQGTVWFHKLRMKNYIWKQNVVETEYSEYNYFKRYNSNAEATNIPASDTKSKTRFIMFMLISYM